MHYTARTCVRRHLYDQRGSALHDLRWYLTEWAVLYRHDLQAGAQGELEREIVQHRVVVDVQTLKRLKRTDLVRQIRKVIFTDTQ